MLQFGNKEFRNLEEQVEKNAQDIQDFKDGNQTIAEFGITVVGILTTAAELPAQGENYGDAYLIGSQTRDRRSRSRQQLLLHDTGTPSRAYGS